MILLSYIHIIIKNRISFCRWSCGEKAKAEAIKISYFRYYVYDSQYWTRRGIVQVPGKLFLGAARSVLKLKEPRILVLRDWTKVRRVANLFTISSFCIRSGFLISIIFRNTERHTGSRKGRRTFSSLPMSISSMKYSSSSSITSTGER